MHTKVFLVLLKDRVRYLVRTAILLSIVYCLLFTANSFSQTPGEWTWMHGDSAPNSLGVFGVQGVSNPVNTPPAVYEPCEWTDNNGNFWLLGGVRAGNNEYAALWKYDLVINQWTWMKGPSVVNQPGVYGIQGIPSPANYPGARAWGATTWTDAAGNLWLFGGYSYDVSGGPSIINDLWRYTISSNEWTWMKGPSIINDPGSYGTRGASSPANLPPSRDETSCSWIDNAGNLWMYGGMGSGGNYGDLWKYDILTSEWTWMHGANTLNAPSVYGIQGVAVPSNTPGGRFVYSSWTDLAGNLWLFGGQESGLLSHNDLWKYDPIINQWTWMNGPNTPNDPGNYGTKCVSAGSNVPPARMENRARVRDGCGNFWLFGGVKNSSAFSQNFNDIWHYNVSTNQWTWVNGDNVVNQVAVYGTKGVSNPVNKAGARMGGVAWMDNNGYIWIFGGVGWSTGFHNDLFRYVPDTACVPMSAVVTASFNTSICIGQSVTLTATGGASYLWSPGGQSTSSIVVSPTITTAYTATGSNGCGSGNSTVTVTVTGITATVGPNSTICAGQSATLTASGGTNYSWINGQTTASIIITPTVTTTYSVVVSNGACSDTGFTMVTVKSGLTVSAGNDVTVCTGTNVTLSASGGTFYSWNTGATTLSITIVAGAPGATTYTVIGTNANGCAGNNSVTVVVNPNPTAVAWSNVTITQGQSVTLTASGGGTYSWSNGTNGSSITVAPLITTLYCVTVTDLPAQTGANNCTDTACVTVTIEQIDCSDAGEIYLPNAFSPNGDEENDKLLIYYGNLKCIKIFRFTIYNRWGEKVFSTNDPLAQWDGSYKRNIEGTSVFVYYLKATLISGEEISGKGNISLIR